MVRSVPGRLRNRAGPQAVSHSKETDCHPLLCREEARGWGGTCRCERCRWSRGGSPEN